MLESAIGPADLRNPRALAWLAGLLDGEGSFRRGTSDVIQLSMKDREPVEFAARILNFPIKEKPRKDRPYSMWYMSVTGNAARWAMTHLRPYLCLRRQTQIDKCLSQPPRQPTRKVTTGEVQQIRERYASGGITQTALGNEYGIGQTTISRIVLRHNRKLV